MQRMQEGNQPPAQKINIRAPEPRLPQSPRIT
jgi:hypothetical protein